MNNKGLVATVVGVVLAAMLASIGGLYGQVQTNRADIAATRAEVRIAVELLKEVRDMVRDGR